MTPRRTLPAIVVGNTTHRVAKAGRHPEGVCIDNTYAHRWQLTRDSRGHCSKCHKSKDFGGQDLGLAGALRAWQSPPRKDGESHEREDS